MVWRLLLPMASIPIMVATSQDADGGSLLQLRNLEKTKRVVKDKTRVTTPPVLVTHGNGQVDVAQDKCYSEIADTTLRCGNKPVDVQLVVESLGDYQVANPVRNWVKGPFRQINMKVGTSTEFEVRLEAKNYDITAQNIEFVVYDMDHQRSRNPEVVQVCGDIAFTSHGAQVKKTLSTVDGQPCVEFESMSQGYGCDNVLHDTGAAPMDRTLLDDLGDEALLSGDFVGYDQHIVKNGRCHKWKGRVQGDPTVEEALDATHKIQQDRSIKVVFEKTNKFKFRFTSARGASGNSGRNILYQVLASPELTCQSGGGGDLSEIKEECSDDDPDDDFEVDEPETTTTTTTTSEAFCEEHICGAGLVRTRSGGCQSGVCTDSLCCEKQGSCKGHTCGLGMVRISEGPCESTSCSDLECCDAEATCSHFDCGEGHVRTFSGGCNAVTCSSLKCCDKVATCGQHTCGAGMLPKPNPKPCKDTSCSEDECCEEEATCDTFSTCGAGFVKIPEAESCGKTSCAHGQCCKPEEKCSSHTCSEGLVLIANKNKGCGLYGCNDDKCCEEEASCSDFICGDGWVKIFKGGCKSASCGQTQCCAREATCSNFDCGQGHVRTKLDGCNGITCHHSQCCDREATCAAHVCGANKVKITDEPCNAVTCSDQKCCAQEATCAEYTCDPGDVRFTVGGCSATACSSDQCCEKEQHCGDFVCQAGTVRGVAEDFGCGVGGCSQRKCCVEEERCESFICPAGKVSAGKPLFGCGVDGCSTQECCVDEGSCDDVSCGCGLVDKLSMKGKGCGRANCVPSLCCEREGTCANVRCNVGDVLVKKDGCNKATCAPSDCCDKQATCAAHTCGAGMVKTSRSPCKGNLCDDAQCCKMEATCQNFQCGAGFIKPKPQAGCNAASCTKNQCCREEQKCSEHSCAAGFVLKDGKEGCGLGGCTDLKCCVAERKCHQHTCQSGWVLLEANKMNGCGVNGCTDGKCCTKKIIVTTTTTTEMDVDPDTDCQGSECIVDEICLEGTVLTFSGVKYNNLGGMGPNFRDPPVIHYEKVAVLNDGRHIDLVISTDGHYKKQNWNFRWRSPWRRYYTGQSFIKEYNGAHKTKGAGVVGTLRKGTYVMKFKFIYSDCGSPAVIPYLPLTFYDIDGNKESTETCDAESALLHKPSDVTGGCQGRCCSHKGSRHEIAEPRDWDKLTLAQKKGSVSYLFKHKSEFKLQYTTTYEHRIFIFKGSKAVACAETTTTTTTTTIPMEPDPDIECQGSHCIVDEICDVGVTTLNFLKLKYNNLGGMGPNLRDPQLIHYTNVGVLNNQPLDLIISTDATYKAKNWNYRWRGMTGQSFIKRYNGVHKTPGAGVVGTLRAGSYNVKFRIVYSRTQKPAKVPFLPITMYDLDGGKETSKTCEAESAVVAKHSDIQGGCTNGCCTHQGSRQEIGLPSNWEKLSTTHKKGSVSYMFQDKSEFTFTYSTSYPHRVFLFKGSRALTCKERPTTTTTTEAKKPDPDVVCEGRECLLREVCRKGTLLNFHKDSLKANNLGNLGPWKGAQKIHWQKVGKSPGGEDLDLMVEAVGTHYSNANFNYVWAKHRMTGRQFIAKYNGVHSTPGAGVIGSLRRGAYKFRFTLLSTRTQRPAKVGYLPLTFYDIDGGYETTHTCDAVAAVTHKDGGLEGGCSKALFGRTCCKHRGFEKEIVSPSNWDRLSLDQKKGSVTYVFKDVSTFEFKYEISYEHRIFIFRGSKSLACVDDKR